jgi:hypothetical protein
MPHAFEKAFCPARFLDRHLPFSAFDQAPCCARRALLIQHERRAIHACSFPRFLRKQQELEGNSFLAGSMKQTMPRRIPMLQMNSMCRHAKDHLSGAIYWVPVNTTDYNGGDRAYNLFHHNAINDAFSAIWNHTFSPNFLNEARVNAAGWRWNEITDNPQAPVGLPQVGIGAIGSPNINLNQFGSALGSDLNQWTTSVRLKLEHSLHNALHDICVRKNIATLLLRGSFHISFES